MFTQSICWLIDWSVGWSICPQLSSLLLFAVATSGIDVIAALMIKGFKESKLEEDMELRMRQTLREVLGPVVPADLEVEVRFCYSCHTVGNNNIIATCVTTVSRCLFQRSLTSR
jgi:hypothetical protein